MRCLRRVGIKQGFSAKQAPVAFTLQGFYFEKQKLEMRDQNWKVADVLQDL